MNTTPSSELLFSSLSLAPQLQRGLDQLGFSLCTPIQAKTLPLTLAGYDVAGQAQTGTGKSAAFLVAMFQQLLQRPLAPGAVAVRGLILAPTRELAIQIHKDAEAIGRYSGLRLALIYGGTGYEQQRRSLEAGADILIGTPGRLIDYYKQRFFSLNQLQVMVLDEADRMFDLGFIKDIRYLLRQMPPPTQRLTMLFSATLSLRVTELAYEHMNNPQRVEIESAELTADNVEQQLFYPASDEKISLLLGLLQQWQPPRAILFVNTKRVGERLWGYLEANGYKTAILSGDVPQKKRQRLLQQFERGEFSLLVATDVAARGLHIADVSHVFNFDLPQDPEDYVHRIGRTARAGASGVAVSFACEEYAYNLIDIESYLGRSLPVTAIQSQLLLTPKPPLRDSSPVAGRRRRRQPPLTPS
ncbi:DEAD/DEAH box helicase [Ectothiorhodospiraceae bacterium BW-2]|nr:DEAD/DEAH box helicase [Ectothiorhodospiraceae bacterium BW-2]